MLVVVVVFAGCAPPKQDVPKAKTYDELVTLFKEYFGLAGQAPGGLVPDLGGDEWAGL